MDSDWPDRLLIGGIIAVLGLIALWFVGLGMDGIQSWRAQSASIGCAAQGMAHERYFLSTRVVCTPRASHGVDTVVVHVPESVR
jgi:hypothetical protein